jgi:hypothetical protein
VLLVSRYKKNYVDTFLIYLFLVSELPILAGKIIRLFLTVSKPKTVSSVPKDFPIYRRPIQSCVLKRFVTRKFLKQNNLILTDLKCKYSNESRNCGISSYLVYRCRKGYVFANKKVSTVSTCKPDGQWSNIPTCIRYVPSSCPLRRVVTRKFLRNNNLRLVDLRCRYSFISRNCGVRSHLKYTCRKGYEFANKES